MAKSTRLAEQVGATPAKLAIVAVLGCVLVGVLWLQFGAGEEEPPVVASERGAAPRAATAATPPPITPAGAETPSDVPESVPESSWAVPRLARVIAYDPFALPAAFPRPAVATAEEGAADDGTPGADKPLASKVEELQMQLEQLRQRGVHVIVRDRHGYVAMIGDRTVHVGDTIGNGFTVTAIEPEGVRVERMIQE